MSLSVAERLAQVRSDIDEACRDAGRDASEVRLVAVSKRQPDESLKAAFAAGHRDFGENYVQELERKQALLPEAAFHMIGHVQTNKAKRLGRAAMVHTVDSAKLARALAKGVEDGPMPVLVEVNLAAEASKAGAAPSEVPALIEDLRSLERLELRGFMCIPPAGEGRRWFSALRTLAEDLRARSGLELPDLSMGMSQDYREAIAEGATLIRVGTAIFGPRPTSE